MFEVFRNVATLNLYGDAGDDTFVIRSFVGESELTALNAGEGRNFIQYAANAPVNIDGGSGYDLVVIIGTEFNDTFVITATGVYGAGRVIRYINVEKVSIYGMEGDDVFHVLSTNPAIELSIFGGLGSDRVEVGSAAPAVQADDLLGPHRPDPPLRREQRRQQRRGRCCRSTASRPRSWTTTSPPSSSRRSAVRSCVIEGGAGAVGHRAAHQGVAGRRPGDPRRTGDRPDLDQPRPVHRALDRRRHDLAAPRSR